MQQRRATVREALLQIIDAIILNSLSDNGAGFGHDTNKVTLITPSEKREFELKTKDLVAIDILNFVEECI